MSNKGSYVGMMLDAMRGRAHHLYVKNLHGTDIPPYLSSVSASASNHFLHVPKWTYIRWRSLMLMENRLVRGYAPFIERCELANKSSVGLSLFAVATIKNHLSRIGENKLDKYVRQEVVPKNSPLCQTAEIG